MFGRSKRIKKRRSRVQTRNAYKRFARGSIGEEITLEWDSSTNNSYCVWKLRAIYSDGPSETENFDFCEQTEIEFDN